MVIRDRIIGVAAVIVGCFVWYLTTTLPEIPVHGDVGPAFFPKLVAGSLFLVGIGLFALDAVTRKTISADTASIPSFRTALEICALLALTVFYLLAMGYTGFVVATAVYIFCCGLLFEAPQRLKLAVFCVLCSGLLYLVFKIWLRVPLPA
jgi:hypothetical protein